jgi:hypothetical protein
MTVRHLTAALKANSENLNAKRALIDIDIDIKRQYILIASLIG